MYAEQGKQILQDGIGRASEVEEPLDAVQARMYLSQPSELLKLPSELMQGLARCGGRPRNAPLLRAHGVGTLCLVCVDSSACLGSSQ